MTKCTSRGRRDEGMKRQRDEETTGRRDDGKKGRRDEEADCRLYIVNM